MHEEFKIKVLQSTPSISKYSGGTPKVVVPLVFFLKTIVGYNNVLLYHKNSFSNFKILRALFLFIRYKPDIVHDHGVWLPFHLKNFILSILTRSSYIISPHGSLEYSAMLHKSLKKKLSWYLYQKYIISSAKGIVVNSLKEYLRLRELGIKGNIAVIENGVEVPEKSLDKILSEKKLSKKALYFSRIHPIKGLIELIDAWSKSDAYLKYEYILDIYGNSDDDEYYSKVKDRIHQLGLQNSVFLKGGVFDDKKWDVYDAHDFFILPSYCENFGIVVLEALYAGLPIITTTGTPWKILEEIGLGKVIPLSVEKLTGAINVTSAELAKQGKISAQFRSKAKTYIEHNYLWPTIAVKYITYYKWILGECGKPDFVLDSQ